VSAAPRLLPSAYVALGVSVVGLAISVYLTIEHYTGSTTLACSDKGAINCAAVTKSAWSHIGPIPVAVLGLAFFVGMTALCTPFAWRLRVLDPLRQIGVVVGLLSVLYLVWVEAFRVDAICLWCTGVHVCTLILLGCVFWTTSELRAEERTAA
jgi:uncharacterized membrane protein